MHLVLGWLESHLEASGESDTQPDGPAHTRCTNTITGWSFSPDISCPRYPPNAMAAPVFPVLTVYFLYSSHEHAVKFCWLCAAWALGFCCIVLQIAQFLSAFLVLVSLLVSIASSWLLPFDCRAQRLSVPRDQLLICLYEVFSPRGALFQTSLLIFSTVRQRSFARPVDTGCFGARRSNTAAQAFIEGWRNKNKQKTNVL